MYTHKIWGDVMSFFQNCFNKSELVIVISNIKNQGQNIQKIGGLIEDQDWGGIAKFALWDNSGAKVIYDNSIFGMINNFFE